MSKNKLDQLDKKIIYELDLNTRISSKQIAKKYRVSKETINFRIKRIKEKGYIKSFVTTLNLPLMGMFFYKIYFKFSTISPEILKQITEYLVNYKRTAQILSMEGNIDIQFFMLAKNVNDLNEFIEPFYKKFGKYIEKKLVHIVTAVYRFNIRFLYDGGEEKTILHNKPPVTPNLDSIDYKIIKEISSNSRTSFIEIAKKLKTSSQFVQYRVKRLVEKNIITSFTLSINYEKLNLEFYHILFRVNDYSVIKKIMEFFKNKKKTIYASETIGEYDCSVELLVKDDKELRKILNELKNLYHGQINAIDVFLVYNEHQHKWFPFIERK